MTATRWFASPLAGTAAVLGVLAVLAIPLGRLTAAKTPAEPPAAATAAPVGKTPAVLRLKLLDPVGKLTVSSPDGEVLLALGPLPAGESEHDAAIGIAGDAAELTLAAEAGPEETAVFLTVMPDGRQDRTLFLTGSGEMTDTLRFDWHDH